MTMITMIQYEVDFYTGETVLRPTILPFPWQFISESSTIWHFADVFTDMNCYGRKKYIYREKQALYVLWPGYNSILNVREHCIERGNPYKGTRVIRGINRVMWVGSNSFSFAESLIRKKCNWRSTVALQEIQLEVEIHAWMQRSNFEKSDVWFIVLWKVV